MSEREQELEVMCDRLAAALVLVCYDAHPTYANTTGWRGGIGGSALTQGCSIIDPPPDADWCQFDLPSGPARDWLRTRDVDLDSLKASLVAEWTATLSPTPEPAATADGGLADA